jgi:NAD-dependent histone deacetylase SIR2
MSSQLSSAPSSSAASPAPDSREDGSPPTKKRRTSYEPKPRTTQHLDFQASDVNATQKESLDRLLKAIHNRRKIVVIAGAGISVSAGSKSTSPKCRVQDAC